MSDNTGPQYHRGGRSAPDPRRDSQRYPTANPYPDNGMQQQNGEYAQTGQYPQTDAYPPGSPLSAATDPAGFIPQVTQRPDDPYDRASAQRGGPATGSYQRGGENYGYDYRYANGELGDDYPRANATGWFALVLSILAVALTWDKFGAFIALGIFFFSFLCAQIALTKRGQRKWQAWIAVWFSALGGLVALLSVAISLVGLMGGIHYAGGKSLMGVVDLPPIKVSSITDVGVTFPKSGLDSITIG
ncbi:MAG: hypothetical protein F2808_02860 [Actinobacteria bacterium]|uniref:Unannotated protein n=1 Tax=freshwater metagenome TaxID=449393 RepID=A0A6J7FE38_9ZZZZ|nr:hypothetical protein [Actinomycetota bacterium]